MPRHPSRSEPSVRRPSQLAGRTGLWWRRSTLMSATSCSPSRRRRPPSIYDQVGRHTPSEIKRTCGVNHWMEIGRFVRMDASEESRNIRTEDPIPDGRAGVGRIAAQMRSRYMPPRTRPVNNRPTSNALQPVESRRGVQTFLLFPRHQRPHRWGTGHGAKRRGARRHIPFPAHSGPDSVRLAQSNSTVTRAHE